MGGLLRGVVETAGAEFIEVLDTTTQAMTLYASFLEENPSS